MDARLNNSGKRKIQFSGIRGNEKVSMRNSEFMTCLPFSKVSTFNTVFFILFFLKVIYIPDSGVFAQYSFSRWDSIQVKNEITTLLNPWSGGLNFPQFSAIDLDGNGKDDLFVFDRSGIGGSKILTFINLEIPDSAAFVHQPGFQKLFPPLQGWALLADYNKDGKQDIFTSNPKGGITVFRNDFSLPGGLKFTLADDLLKAGFGGNKLEVYVSPWDIPAIADIDNDGDLDILSYNVGGSFVTYFKNTSMENFGIPDSLVFEMADACWGKFKESFENCDISIGVSCKENGFPSAYGNLDQKHAGSTLLALDLDGDYDMELIVGDLVCNYLTRLTNGGSLISADITEIDTQFPSELPVKLSLFPAAFYLDLDNDGIKDLTVAPSAINISENFKSVWWYKNEGSNGIPQFKFKSNSFLQETMIEAGEGASAAFFDADGDGLQDIVIGNFGYYKTGPNYLSELSLYKNTGTKTNPSFQLTTRDFAGVSALGLTGVSPAFGDIDNDADLDMIIGESKGELYLFENSAGAGANAIFSLTGPGYKDIDVGQFSSPQLVDVNKDGKIDLLIGERNGNINYYENSGSEFEAEFTLKTDSFGKVNILEEGSVTGYSVPRLVELDSTSDYSLLAGSESGKIYLFKGIEGNLSGEFLKIDTFFQNISEGIRSTIDLADINNDGNRELMVGNYRGGVAIFKNNASPRKIIPAGEPFALKLFPNPVRDIFFVNIPEINSNADIFFYNILGELIFQRQIVSAGKYYLNSKSFSSGIYHCKLVVDGVIIFSEKIMFVK